VRKLKTCETFVRPQFGRPVGGLWPVVCGIQKLKRLKLGVKDRLAKGAATAFGKRLRLQKI